NAQAFIKNNSILAQRIVAHIENPIDHIKITACVPENKNYIIVDTINQIALNDDIDQYVIWYLLNSKLISWYAYRFIFGKAIRTMQFDNPTTARLPIPENIKDNQTALAKPIKELLKIGQELQNTSVNTDKWHSLKNEIEKAEKQIDEAIYKLYGLTDDEIKTIEQE
ncbi:MAG: Type I restriction-modification system methyltransferase subunit, partial [Candidatus Yanofskybacteria bacterium GW2011_GWA2_44_9]